MSLIVIAADKGAPGVTTTALALAAVWPKPVLLAECDPSGGDLVYRFPAANGGSLDPRRGLLTLAVAARRGLQTGQLWEHTQKMSGGLDVLTGVINAEQGAGLGALWGPLGELFAAMSGGDVIADCGRLGPDGPHYDMLAQASVVVLVTRPHPGDIIRLRDRAAVVTAAANARGRRGFTPAVVLVADQRTLRATAAEVGQTLTQGNVPAGVVGGIADDAKGAELLRGEWGGRLDKTLLIRTARETAQQLAASLPADRDDGGPPAPPRPAAPQSAPSAQPHYPPAQPQYPPGPQYPPPSPPAGPPPYPAGPQYPPPAQHAPPAQHSTPPAQHVPPAQHIPPAPPQQPQPPLQQYPPAQPPRGAGGRHSASAQPAAAGHEAGDDQWTTA
jgi:MinD-like ATPase involved in chromosome partitioning or flagellar assembly